MGNISFIKNSKIKGLFMVVAVILVFWAKPSRAASLYITPDSGTYNVGQSVGVYVRVNSPDQGFNAAQATIVFPKDLFKVESISSGGADSIFDFWLEDPKFSNEDGRVTFLGGASNGIVGPGLPLLKINFKAYAAGQGVITASDAAVTASDGSGTNILSKINGASIVVVPSQDEPKKPLVATSSPSEIVIPVASVVKAPEIPLVAPTVIKRKAVIVSNLPSVPVVKIGVYNDPTKWYGIISNFLAEWDLPLDISDVNVAVNKEYNFTPSGSSEGLIANKTFPALTDGIWYLHVRFKNNIGWGPVAHYRIALDSEAPSMLKIESDDNFSTSNPSPVVHFKSNDALSGVEKYLIKIDDNEFIGTTESTFTLPLQDPGKHIITVRSVDKAGNMREARAEMKIGSRELPILVIAGLKITQFWFFAIFSLMLLSAFFSGWYVFRARNKQTSRKVVVAERDVMNMFDAINKDVDHMLQFYSDNHLDERESQEVLTYLKKIKTNIEKSQKYILMNIQEISK